MSTAILIVDDDPAIRQILVDLLTEEHCAVRTAADGREALAGHRAAAADLIISDGMMPGLDGPGLVQALRATGDPTPVILLSAVPVVPCQAGTLALGKPFNIDELVRCIAQLLPGTMRAAD